jgi:hypothetical protein
MAHQSTMPMSARSSIISPRRIDGWRAAREPIDRETGKTGKNAAKLSGIRRKADVV